MVMGCNIIQEVKGLTKNYLLSRRKTSFYAKFQIALFPCFYMVMACIIMTVLSGLSVKQEVKGLTTNYITMHYPRRKLTNIRVHLCYG